MRASERDDLDARRSRARDRLLATAADGARTPQTIAVASALADPINVLLSSGTQWLSLAIYLFAACAGNAHK